MIEINLLPEDLRSSKQAAFDWNNVVYAGRLGLVILVVAHIILFLVAGGYKYKVGRMRRQWLAIAGDNKEVLALRKDITALRNRAEALNGLLGAGLPWPGIWDKLSLYLPEAAWFKRIRVTPGVLDIQGSILAISVDEMGMLNSFLQDIREDAIFRRSFDNMDIISISRNDLFGVEVIDFSIKGVLSTRSQ